MKAIEILLLLSDLEGAYAHTKKHGFLKDNELLNEMKSRYYKMYFKSKKEKDAKSKM